MPNWWTIKVAIYIFLLTFACPLIIIIICMSRHSHSIQVDSLQVTIVIGLQEVERHASEGLLILAGLPTCVWSHASQCLKVIATYISILLHSLPFTLLREISCSNTINKGNATWINTKDLYVIKVHILMKNDQESFFSTSFNSTSQVIKIRKHNNHVTYHCSQAQNMCKIHALTLYDLTDPHSAGSSIY